MSQPVLIAVEPWLIGSRTIPTVSLLDSRDYLKVHEDLSVWWARQQRTVLLREGHDFALGGMVSRTANHFRDIRLTVAAARQVLGPIRSVQATALARDLVSWEQARVAEGVVPSNETPVVGHLFGYEAPPGHSTIRLSIAGTDVRQDADGRFCLNDCHKASGGNSKDGPGQWLRTEQAKALIAEIKGGCAESHTPVTTINDGRNNGTYVVRELVHAYAMWISAAYALTVIRAFDGMVQHASPLAQPSPTTDEQAWAAWLALPISERRCRQRDIATFGRTYGVEGMRHAMKRVGLPAPPTYTADAGGQFEMPFRQIGAVRTISDPPEGSA